MTLLCVALYAWLFAVVTVSVVRESSADTWIFWLLLAVTPLAAVVALGIRAWRRPRVGGYATVAIASLSAFFLLGLAPLAVFS